VSIDCSVAAQAERRKQLAGLRAKMNSGVQSVSDRSRSVGYVNYQAMRDAIAQLEREIAYCNGERPPSRLSYIPLTKGY
jgi:hypothetical protein